MKKASILACALLFVSVAAFAQTPQSHPALTQEALAAILGQPAASSCATQPSGVRQVARRPTVLTEKALCTASVTCPTGNISCSSNTSTSSCTAVNRNCLDNEKGHVTCDGITTQCSTPCDCNVYSGTQHQCCLCAQTDDCVACCRCDGFTLSYCGIHVC
jgi:hypothetical protein